MIDIRPRDRVLLLSLVEAGTIRRLARQASEGIVVGIGPDDAVRETRRAVADLVNVMIIPAAPDEIPWQENFFSVIIGWTADWSYPDRVAREVARVLAPGGQATVPMILSREMTAAGLREIDVAGDGVTFEKIL